MTHRDPRNLPDGQDYEAIFGGLPQTATPAALHLAVAVAALLAGLLLFSCSRGAAAGSPAPRSMNVRGGNVRVAGERGGPFGRAAADALAFAEAQGAAPGTEFRVFGPVESSPLDRRTRRTPAQRLLAALAAASSSSRCGTAGRQRYLHAKAALGQDLLCDAWERGARAASR